MKAYIWDLDGTLIDSYEGIMDSLMKTVKKFKIEMKKEDVYNFILQKSVHEFLSVISEWYGLDEDAVTASYSEYRLETQLDCKLMPGALKTLKTIKKNGGMNFIYTHKGDITSELLKKLKIEEYFTETVTIKNGFKRKPDPEAVNYILDKYDIEKCDACYIGDRPLDIECAKNAGITGYLYIPDGSPVKPMDKAVIIHKLEELV